MLRAALRTWFRRDPDEEEASEGRDAFHSDIRAIRPDAWSSVTPPARGREVERAMWLSGVSTRDFRRSIDVTLSPDRVTPSDDIVELCDRKADACRQRANELAVGLPAPNAYGRPPLPAHRRRARQARELYRAADAWMSLSQTLLSNRWPA